ncbi:hypothetical protein KSX_41920 [Ktedonospora formicarum]|uniref:Uncharacterized protein n=1 Tax=Ktedonospora formicarum TaxID=2778364 RepID=A0A8J3I7B0_9CHLR|nr:hypothetical protein KSX_41920 [Ktedonospora formicarum]
MGQTDKGVKLIINVTGQPDPKGGQACPNNDDGKPHTTNENFANGITSSQAQAERLPKMLFRCRLECFWIDLSMGCHQPLRSW